MRTHKGLDDYTLMYMHWCMIDAPTRFEALQRVIAAFGSQEAAAENLSVSQSTVSRWLNQSKQMPAEFVLRAEAATGVSRHHLRPDIYPVDMPDSPSRWSGVDQCAGIRFNGVDRRQSRVSFNSAGETKGAAA